MSKTAKRLTVDQRQALVADIETGDYTGKQLAEKHSVSVGTIAIAKRKLRSDGVTTSTSTSGVTTSAQLSALIRKAIQPMIKKAQTLAGADNAVQITTSIQVGKVVYNSYDELVEAATESERQAETAKQIAALKAQIAALEAS